MDTLIDSAMDNLIDRSVAVEWFERYRHIDLDEHLSLDTVIADIEFLPPADAVNIANCKDCRHKHIADMVSEIGKALGFGEDAHTIDSEYAHTIGNEYAKHAYWIDTEVELEPEHGIVPRGTMEKRTVCSACGFFTWGKNREESRFCPECGARMDGEVNETNRNHNRY